MPYTYKEGGKEGKVFVPKEKIDKGTIGQIKRMTVHPAIEHPRVMPDCHKGKGCCIGFTSVLIDKVVPEFVGGDIGCGILVYPIGQVMKTEEDMARFDQVVRERIPMGKYSHTEPIVDDVLIDKICRRAMDTAVRFADAFREKYGININKWIPDYTTNWVRCHGREMGILYDDTKAALGTLGGGNHYIEVNRDDDGEEYISIHSGSRSFGSHVCEFHQRKITNNRRYDWAKHDEMTKKLSRNIKDAKHVHRITEEVKNEFFENRHPDYLEADEAYDYFFDMIFAQEFAAANRRIMLKEILDVYGIKYLDNKIIESVHNYIDFTDFIMRKGAIGAYKEKECVIALNMRDGIFLCEGKSNPDWNYSAAHGAGRLLDRNQANNKISLKEFEKSMEGIYSSSVVRETIDEAPMAYKDTEFIREMLKDTVEIKKQIKPIINIKALS